MTWLQRMRPVLFTLGILLLVATLIGAGAISAGNTTPGDAPKSAPAPSNGGKVGGPVVLGTVDSDPSPVAYGLPPVLQTGVVAKVFVKDGDEVSEGAELYVFDTSIQNCDLERGRVAVSQAKNEIAKANEAKKQHTQKVAVVTQSVKAAADKVNTAANLYTLIKNNLENGYKVDKIDPSLWKEKLANSPELFKANADYLDAVSLRDRLQSELDLLNASNIELLVKQAEIALQQADAELEKAQMAVNLCTVRAKTAGTIEQVKISAGSTLGISTRDPALWLIPAGSRIVRAEVEADFAHRVSADIIRREVVIMDHTDPKITYRGVVRRVGGTFLPKRSETLLQSDTRVLECVVEVTDPAPPGKPPLRVGQRVRVNLGQ